MDTEEKMLHMFEAVHGEMSGSCSAEIYYEDDPDCHEGYSDEASGISVVKHGHVCWSKSKSDILFDFITKDM